jgi:hypothetical protein
MSIEDAAILTEKMRNDAAHEIFEQMVAEKEQQESEERQSIQEAFIEGLQENQQMEGVQRIGDGLQAQQPVQHQLDQ